MQIFKKTNLDQALVILQEGKTLVFPTETSYGLGCDAANQKAVDRIFKIKGRKSDKPLLVVVPSVEMAKKYLVWNELLDKLARKYWPGALTIVGEYLSPPLFKEGLGEVTLGEVTRLIGFNRTKEFRQDLRKNKTTAEKILWSQIKGKKMNGLKFRRQHGIGPYIVDFYQPDSQLVVELDGDIHFETGENLYKDIKRTEWLEGNGYSVLRFNNIDIFDNLEGVLQDIYNQVTSPSPLLKKRGVTQLADGVVSRDNTLAIRVTAHPVAKFFSEQLDRPIVATSANIADAGDVYGSKIIIKIFEGRKFQPDALIDYGELPKNPPTTMVSVVNNKLKILRQGELTVV